MVTQREMVYLALILSSYRADEEATKEELVKHIADWLEQMNPWFKRTWFLGRCQRLPERRE